MPVEWEPYLKDHAQLPLRSPDRRAEVPDLRDGCELRQLRLPADPAVGPALSALRRSRAATLPAASERVLQEQYRVGRVHPAGKAVYVSNRGHNSIAVFAVDAGTGLLSPLGWVPSQPIPRPLGISSDGRFFFAGSDESGRLSSFRIDEGGMLEPLETYEVGEFVSWILPLAFN